MTGHGSLGGFKCSWLFPTTLLSPQLLAQAFVEKGLISEKPAAKEAGEGSNCTVGVKGTAHTSDALFCHEICISCLLGYDSTDPPLQAGGGKKKRVKGKEAAAICVDNVRTG